MCEGRRAGSRAAVSNEAALTVGDGGARLSGDARERRADPRAREAARTPGVSILHAATRRDGETIVADGGRVLAVTARGRDVAEARARAYAAVDGIDWPGGFCRRDIGWRAVAAKTEVG